WRRRAIELLAPRLGERILDLACGTGDCSREIGRRAPGAQVFGADFSREMLRRYEFGGAQADALALPVRAASFDGAICAFGMRNVPEPVRALAEVHRALRSGGRLVVLEFFRKQGIALRLARLVGGIVSGDRMAYDYLARSIESTVTAEQFATL